MPRRRRYARFTKSEIRVLAFAIPILFIIGVGIIFIILLSTWFHSGLGLPIELIFAFAVFAVLALIICVPVVFIFLYIKEMNENYKGIKIANIDLMSGIEFEKYLSKLLIYQGYSVR